MSAIKDGQDHLGGSNPLLETRLSQNRVFKKKNLVYSFEEREKREDKRESVCVCVYEALSRETIPSPLKLIVPLRKKT